MLIMLFPFLEWNFIILFVLSNVLMHMHLHAAAAAAKLPQSCPTLCDLIDGSPPGSPVTGILQAKTLKWVAISFPNAWKWKEKVKSLSRVWLLATPWTAAHQAPLSMGFSRQECWSGVPLPSPCISIMTYNSFCFCFSQGCSSKISRDYVWGLSHSKPLMGMEMSLKEIFLSSRHFW